MAAKPSNREPRPAAPPRPQPVLLAGRRGDRAAPDRPLRGARGRVRDPRADRCPARPRGGAAGGSCGTASRSSASRRPRSSAPASACAALNYVTYLGSTLAAALAGPAAGPRPLHDRSADGRRRRPRRREALRGAAARDQRGRLPRDRDQARRLENPVLVGVLRQLVRLYLKRADRVVAIGETMRQRLEAKGAPGERIRVIPNWIDTRTITPQRARERVEGARRARGHGSSSCTRATSAMPRTSTCSFGRRPSCATSTTSGS